MASFSTISFANLEYLSKYKSIDKVDFLRDIKTISKDISKTLGDKKITVIFVSNEYIKKLNKDFRKKNESTDVLSFNLEEDNNEVYVSPSYIYRTYRKESFGIEIMRVIIHGILHIYGYDHKGKFLERENNMEEMFKIQENILNNVVKNN